VTHRRAGKTVACVHDLQRAAPNCANLRPRVAVLDGHWSRGWTYNGWLK
jgi:hypothetical protein